MPQVNFEAWAKLSSASANLNQITRYLNSGMRRDVDEVSRILAAFRRQGAQFVLRHFSTKLDVLQAGRIEEQAAKLGICELGPVSGSSTEIR